MKKLLAQILIGLGSLGAYAEADNDKYTCLSKATLEGGTPAVNATFYRYTARVGRPKLVFPGIELENGQIIYKDQTEFFQAQGFRLDGCSFRGGFEFHILVFQNGEAYLAENHNSWQDSETIPFKAIYFGHIDDLPNWNGGIGWNKNGQFEKEVILTSGMNFNLDIKRSRHLVGYYGIPLGMETDCQYTLAVATPSGQIQIKANSIFGRAPGESKKRCL